jgi:hypothetical protein
MELIMEKIIKTISILSILLLRQTMLPQTNVDLRPQVNSPEVFKFEQYLNMPVNMVAGVPQVNIPIYNLEYGDMSLPISLEYDASGVKVESIASSVGQNWSLNVGGVVSRIVKGIPDEGIHRASISPRSLFNIDGYYQDYGIKNLDKELDKINGDNFAALPNKNVGFNYFLEDVSNGYKDSQPDLFYFSTPQGGGKFVFNDERQVVYLENTDFIIKEDYVETDHFFRTWNATSPMGIKYKFGLDTGIIQSWKSKNNCIEQTGTRGVGEDAIFNNQTNSWFLTEISNYTNNKKITIDYIDNIYEQIVNHTPTVLRDVCLPLSAINGNCNITDDTYYNSFALDPKNFAAPSPGDDPFSYLTRSDAINSRTDSKIISKITAGNTTINFLYSDREDLLPDILNPSNKGKKLQQINIFESGICIKKL